MSARVIERAMLVCRKDKVFTIGRCIELTKRNWTGLMIERGLLATRLSVSTLLHRFLATILVAIQLLAVHCVGFSELRAVHRLP